MVLHFFLGDCLLYKVNILFLMMDMSVLAWTCPQTLGPPSGHANMLRIFPARRRPRMKEPASGKQSQLDNEQKHARLGQPGWHERRIRDVSPGGSLIACSARLIVKLLLPDAGLLFCKAKAGGRLVRARLPAKPMNLVFEREP